MDAETMALFNTTARPDVVAEVSTQAAQVVAEPKNNTMIYAAAGGGLLLLIVGGYFMFGRKPAAAPQTDPLLAGMEGLEGMDLTGMDLSALGMDQGGQAPL